MAAEAPASVAAGGPERPTVVAATALGSWPGTDPVEAARTVRGELGAPNLPHLVELPDRGSGSDPVGRTAAMLVDLAVDLQPHGWRLVDRPGQDQRRAVSALATDLSVLADVVGAEENPGRQLKLQLRGPLSLAANLYLHYGERALLDAGARRDIAQSLAAGAAEHLSKVAGAVPAGTQLVVQLDEPEIGQVLSGSIPTASGYRTLRSIPAPEVSRTWQEVADALRAAGAVEIVLAIPAEDAALEAVAAAGVDGFALPAAGLTTARWEAIAAAVESDRRIWLGAVHTADPAAPLPQVRQLVESVLRPWRQLGLPAASLPQLRITPSTGLAGHSLDAARLVLTRLGQVADALNQVVAEA
ncbi:hypothetical protein LVY72_12610 [Arthrobacter sp. I2-34]|uniref:Cobalamin-independent methionine synthase MetE C-terminal/archaeal domain-containing protein n=1 Tax=Arthrobacter hankyongi TaxID=2904801 RepID=A0ABS9L7U6_9MICC|nr:hypothetical protein [Arthrobacter hankyongi]MCG2622744.1 hypothetical protein [Arthrobacter hankyongi]